MYVAVGPFQFLLSEQFEFRSDSPFVRHLPRFTRESADPSVPIFRINIVASLAHPPIATFRRIDDVCCFTDSAAIRQIFITTEMKSMIDWGAQKMDIELRPISEDPEFDDSGKVMVLLRMLVSFATVRCGGLPLHCSCVGRNGRAVAFFGKSGAGKSTIARIMVKNGWHLLNDEYNLLIPDARGGYRAYSTPFSKTSDPVGNPAEGVEISNAFGLRHGEFSAATLPLEKAVREIMGSVYILPDFAAIRGLLLDAAATACARLQVRDLRFDNCDATAGLLDKVLGGGL